MNLNSYQLCDDWGWFIDIECNDNILLQPCKPGKKLKPHFNKLNVIDEDEYDYYQKNYKDPEENYKIPNKNYDINLKTGENNTLVNVGSTTLITALLTYVIFFIL